MASGLMTGTGVLLDDSENAIWDLEKGNFPVTFYDRPQLALSNIILRGNVDAATRSMLAPHTLTPTEMRTISDKFVGKSNSKVLKTIADVVTNPLVILAAAMALKYPLGGEVGSNALFTIGRGLAKGTPGPLLSRVSSAFTNLRNVPNAFKSLFGLAVDTGNMKEKYGEAFNNIFKNYIAKTGKKLSHDELLKVSADLQGMGEGLQYHMVNGELKQKIARGVRKYYKQVMKRGAPDQPMWPGLRESMSPELRKFSDELKGWYTKFHGEFTKDPVAYKKLVAEQAAKGNYIGEYMDYYHPIHARFSPLEGAAARSMMTDSVYRQTLERARTGIAGALKPAMGVTIGDVKQMREWERLGMPPIVDDILSFVKKDAVKMENFLHEAWQVASVQDTAANRAEAFALQVMKRAGKAGMNTRMRLGPGKLGEEALKNVANQLDSVAHNADKFKQKIAGLADVLVRPAEYDMRPIQSARRYLTQMSSSWAYHMAPVTNPATNEAQMGWSSVIEPIMEGLKGTRGFQHSYMRDQLVPMLRGLKPHNAYARATMMGEYKESLGLWLATHPLAQKIPEGSRKFLQNYFSNFSNLSSEGLGAKISEFFYVSTLGLNMAPASKNLLQNYLTTLHMPGINKRGLVDGMAEMTKGVKEYAGLLAKGLSREEAFNSAFKDYVTASGKGTGMAHAMKMGDIAKEGLASTISAGAGVWDKTKDIMLTPFATTEAFNRLFGFYVGKNSYLATHGPKAVAEALEFGTLVNHAAHFPGGPLGLPKALLGVWGPARQFMHFPLRYAEFLGSSMMGGAGIEGLARAKTVATSLGGSAAAYIAAKNLMGVDISPGLMSGALPVPAFENAPFYPFPLVPPMAAVGGEMVKAVASGETEGLARSASLLVPGGVAMRRLYKTLGPKYADYKTRTADGRVPVFNDKKALIGAFTPWQLTMKAMGMAPVSQQAEYGAAKWLLTQREKIRAYRRDYLEALADNDVRKADQINGEFQKAYPELGPLQMKKADIKAVHNRREISRLQRIAQGFPAEYRPLFEHMVSQAGLSGITQQLESRPLAIDQYSPLMQP